MANQHLLERIEAVRQQLLSGYAAGRTMSSASKGREREAFIDDFLKNVFPPIYRFGTGDATDRSGLRSGQLDVVIEYPFGPSLPAAGISDVRLYLAESVAAVVEVKSDLQAQWNEVISTARQLRPIKRHLGTSMIVGEPPPAYIPLIAVGFQGWKRSDTAVRHLEERADVAVLVIEENIFAVDDKMAKSSQTRNMRSGA
ncbi:DUF6602 domain-containing protein [Chelativorans sp. YIM 93263]|uniref:DUF6602 domain-containing protein n=1 Tax=Chelativorans sp. YIM 93263 TaxID=2906648 RepID=UPI00237876EE|nr:DUF6602 domain-containing protein [Chelativorans sp. YIM 93263]